MTETPLVVYLAQRPGPATGLATRTAQADLFMALYASPRRVPARDPGAAHARGGLLLRLPCL